MVTYVIFYDLLEFSGYSVAFERDCLLSIYIYRGHGLLAGARQADADVGVFALARAVHHADRKSVV